MKKQSFSVKSCVILLAMLLLGASSAWANIVAQGTVTDTSGEPLIGVSVVEKG